MLVSPLASHSSRPDHRASSGVGTGARPSKGVALCVRPIVPPRWWIWVSEGALVCVCLWRMNELRHRPGRLAYASSPGSCVELLQADATVSVSLSATDGQKGKR